MTAATTADHVVKATEVHAAMTVAQEDLAATAATTLLKLQSRTTSRRCSRTSLTHDRKADL
jgi:hypothetical protein